MTIQSKKTILLVEDSSVLTEIYTSMLRSFGYQVVHAGNGKDAIETVDKRSEIDLILMDIDLGTDMDGTQAGASILNKHNIPIVFLSSHTEPEIVQKK